MKKNALKLKLIALSLSLAALLSITSTAFASSLDRASAKPADNSVHILRHKPRKAWRDKALISELQSLVSEKIITKEQADKITAFINEQKEKKKAELDKLRNMNEEEREKYVKDHFLNKSDIFDELVASGIITKDQGNIIRTRIHNRSRSRLQQVLKSEVAKGTIKQEQLDKINEFLDKKMEERKARIANIKAMTKAERKSYFAQNPKKKTDLMEELVSEGIITKEQKEALIKAIREEKNKSRDN